MKLTVLWDVVSRGLGEIYRCFSEMYFTILKIEEYKKDSRSVSHYSL
jgi:hypothetical protein